MNPPVLTVVIAAVFLASMAAYALFAGADFGGGIWDLLAGGTEQGDKPRAAIDASVTPVWEGNHVWIVLGLALFWTAFPLAFGAVFTALFVPLSLSLLGILLRGIGFAFRHEAERLPLKQLSGVLFAASSVMAPFFLGTCVGAVATGKIPRHPGGNLWGAWTSPTAIVTGLLFMSTCAYIGGAYLIADSDRRGQPDMVRYFTRRAVAAGVVTGALAAVNLVLLHGSAPRLWHRLLQGPGLPAVIVSVVAGAAALLLMLANRPHLLRLAAAFAVIGVVAGWALAQYPYLLPGALTLGGGSAPSSTYWAEVAVVGLALLFVLPAFVYLYWLQQHGRLQDTESSTELRQAVAAENGAETGERPPDGRRHPVVAAVVIGAAVGELVRDTLVRRRRR